MSKLKSILLMGLSMVLVAALSIGGTLAYLQDSDEAVNVMTLGNVSIDQIELQRADGVAYNAGESGKGNGVKKGALVPFEQNQPLYPAVPKNNAASDYTAEATDLFFWGDYVYSGTAGNGLWNDDKISNVMDKFVFVKNTGKTDAFFRTLIAFECPEGMEFSEGPDKELMMNTNGGSLYKWEKVGYITVNGVRYLVWEATYQDVLKPGNTSHPSLLQVLLTHNATNEDMELLGGTYEILVVSQAVQAAGFQSNPMTKATISDAKNALDTAFGLSKDHAAEWFGGVKSANFVPANAVKIDNSITHDEFAALLSAGKNIYLTESVTIANPEPSRFTEFDVNGEVGIWAAEGATLTFGETTGIVGDGVLTVYSGAIDEKQELWVGATLVFEGGEHTFAALSVSGDGKIVVNDGTLNCMGTYAGIMGITFGENGQFILNNGKINLYQPINLNPNRCDAAYVEINGGTVELLNGIENLFVVRNVMDKDKLAGGVLRGSSIRISGGTFIAHYEIDSAGDATSFIRNGDSPADGNKVLVSNADEYDCVVTGGTFYGSWQRADNTRYTDGNGGYADGKMVDNSIAGFVANGYKITGDATNGYIVSAN